jgi:regulator of replication initiation timing
VDPLYIEDTDDWLGNPTPLETCRHQLRMYENEFEALTLKLDRALANIEGLVRDNDALRLERDSLKSKLQYAEGGLLSEKRRFADVEHSRNHLFNENQRLLREARDREEMAGHCECCAEKGL